MTKAERNTIVDQRREAKRQMKIARPLIGYLGNQYFYWENKWKDAKRKLGEI